MKELVLGVDGGNTKTVALVARPDGTVVGSGRGGCSDIYGAPSFAAAIDQIAVAVTTSLPAEASIDDVGTAVFSLAGADWDEDRADLHAALTRLVPRAEVVVVNDALGALRAGTKDGIGVSVVVGTGGCVGAADNGGRSWYSGWWGLHTGAWAIGGDALRAVYNAELTVGPPTTLTPIALEVFGEATVEGLLHSFTRRGGRAAWDAALLAPSVLRLARAGDSVALELLRDHGTRLGTMARVAASKVELKAPFPLVLLGGLLRGEGSELIVEEIVSRLPEAVPVRPNYEPVAGALLLALDKVDAGYDARLVETTMPRGHIYDTVRSRRVP